MNELEQILKTVQKQWGVETVQAIIRKIEQDNIIWEGNLKNSIRFKQEDNGDITFLMKEYGEFLDEGVNGTRSAYATAYQYRGNWKGMGFALTKWADSKGLNPYAVARSLQEKGLKPRRFFKSVIESRAEDLATSIGTAYNDYLSGLLGNQ
jgi:hypothetical protein